MPADTVQLIVLADGYTTGTYALQVGDTSYLSCNSNSSTGYFRTANEITENSSWSINIADTGAATIQSQISTDTTERSVLRYNSSSSLFNCYKKGQAEICIYKLYKTTTDDSIDEYGTYISVKKTVVPDDKLYIRYYPVLGEGVEANEIGMQYWDHSPDLNDETDTPVTITAPGYDSVQKMDYFCTGGLKPNEMLNVQYVRLYVTVGETTYYTPVIEFGLEAYLTALEASDNPSATAVALVKAAIAYGEAAVAYYGNNG